MMSLAYIVFQDQGLSGWVWIVENKRKKEWVMIR
jgi:hypothetical protein